MFQPHNRRSHQNGAGSIKTMQGPPQFSQFATTSNSSRDRTESGPLFDYFVNSDDQVELLHSRQANQDLQRCVQELERINHDLEERLENEAKQNIDIEHECTEIDRIWRLKCEVMENEVREWKAKYERQEKKAERLREQISRTERELYGILQRKYEWMRGGGNAAGGSGGPGGLRRSSVSGYSGSGPVGPFGSLRSSDALVRDNSNKPSKGYGDERQKEIVKGLGDFLGL